MFRSNIRLFFLLPFCLAVLVFESSALSVENLLGTNSSIEEIRQLYRDAELAMSRQDYQKAQKTYLELLHRGVEKVANTGIYVDVVLRLAASEMYLENFTQAEERLTSLLQRDSSEGELIRIESLRSQLHQKRGKQNIAYRILKELEDKIPLSRWPAEEKSFLIGLEYTLNKKYSDLLLNAEALVDALLYEESIPLYREVIDAIADGSFPLVIDAQEEGENKDAQIRYRLAEAYFHLESYGDALALLEQISPKRVLNHSWLSLSEEEKNSFYLLGRVYEKMGKREHAISSFETYLGFDDKASLIYHGEVHWRLGLIYFQREDFKQAEHYFKNLSGGSGDIKFYYLARIYLARIYLMQKDYKGVEQTLFPLLGIFTEDESLRYEVSFLRGEAFFQRAMYTKAVEFFEQSLPVKNKEFAKWYPQALYNLAWCYLKLGEGSEILKEKRFGYLDKAEKAFRELIQFNGDDRSYLGLVRLNLLRVHYFDDRKARSDAEKILESKGAFSSIEFEAEALVLQSELAETYVQREKALGKATGEDFKGSDLYGSAWYFRGINDFKQGKNLAADSQVFEANILFDRAITAFQKAFVLLKEKDPSKAGLSLGYAAQASFYKNNKESRLQSYQMFDRLFNEYSNIFKGMEDQDKFLYFQAVVASRLLYEDKQEEFVKAAEIPLLKIIDEYSEGEFVDISLKLLATIYFREGNFAKAERDFVRLAATYPQSDYAGDAWFWAGECAQWQRKDIDLVRDYRKKVFEKYPKSKHGAEAYFKYYSFSEYMQGNAEALAHLQNMELLYSDSSYLIIAYYLTGMNHKQDRRNHSGTLWKKADLSAAIHSFEQAQKVFDRNYAMGAISASNLEYFVTVRYRALLERALIKLQMAESVEGAKQQVYLDWAELAFEEILQDFYHDENSLARFLTRGFSYPRIFQESEYGLVKVYTKAKKNVSAEELLSKMLEKYAKANVEKGYYLSRVWYEQGRIAIDRGEYELALKFFKYAEETAKGDVLNTQQRLDLWVQQSHCFRELKQFDTAMLMLSKVINEDVVSPLRLKAMYLRAEIYELEGRHELAIRQLEATAKKGGQWANKAKEKLEKNYGFN